MDLLTTTETTKQMEEKKSLIVELKYDEYKNDFRIDFSDENGYLVSVKLNTEGQAMGYSRSLGIKIMYG